VNKTLEHIVSKFEIDLSQPSPVSIRFSRFGMVDIFRELDFKVGAEIGTEHGEYAKKICRANPQLFLNCVDCYKALPYYKGYETQEKIDSYYESAVKNLSPYQHKIWKTTSMEAVKNFEDNSLDFVFIDGNHYFEFVVNDAIYWSRKVKPNGIVYGHDYSDQFHVKQAINAYMDAYKIKHWFVLQKKGLVDSWMFVREEEDQIW
jgi:hypothetical protein